MNLAARLKAETSALHDHAEGHAFQRTFSAGKLPQDDYVRYLGQMCQVYDTLETEIERHRADSAVLSGVIEDRHFRRHDLAADLAHFGCDPGTLPPIPATRGMIDAIRRTAADNPAALLGYHYVLEGSNNGLKYIARNVRRAYDLTDAGPRYLDPYGDDQPAVWAAYKQALGALDLSTEASNAIVQTAQAMFRGVAAISSEMLAPATP